MATASEAPRPFKSAPSQTIDLAVFGMTCAACATRIEKVVNRLPGTEGHVNLATERARVRLGTDSPGVPAVIEAIRKAGYDAQVLDDNSRSEEKARHREEYKREMRHFWIAAL